MTQREIIRNNLNKSDWEITKHKCDSTRAHRRHLAANRKHENKRKIYCTNVHLRIIEILITLMYNLSAVTAAVTLPLYPATPGWGVRRGCVCLGSGFSCAPPLLAVVLGCVCGGVGAPLVPRHSWLGCAVRVWVFGLGFRLQPATPGWAVGVCVLVCVLPLYPATAGWGVRRWCACLVSGFGCAPPLLAGVFGCACWCVCSPYTPPFLAGVCGVGVCVGARAWAAPRHPWLWCWGVCVLVCVLPLYPATSGWGVRPGCVCLGSGFSCAPPLLAGVLGCVCAAVRAPPVPHHSWLGCALWVCALGLGFLLRPATPGWGVGVCGLAVSWHQFLCRGSLRVLRAARVCGTWWPLLLGTFPCAFVLACGVPHWPASWPRVGAPRLVWSGRSRCSDRLSRRGGAFPHPVGLRPRLYWEAVRGTQRPAENRAHCACRWPPPEQGRWAGSASYRFAAPPWGCPCRVRLASVLGCVRCSVWRVWTRPLTRLVSRTARLSTGNSAGAPGLFRVDADTAPFGSEDATPGSRACVRIRAFLAGSGGPASWARSGAPHPFLSPLLLLSLSARPLRAGVALLVLFLGFFFLPTCAPPLSAAFPVLRPWVPWALAFCGTSPPLLCFSCFFSFFFSLPPACFFFRVFLPFSFFFVLCWLCSAGLVFRGLWGVLVCVVVGLVLRRGPVCACVLLFGAPCLCVPLLFCCLLCCVCPMAPCRWRCSSPCCLWWLPCGVARRIPPAGGAGFFFLRRVCAGCPPPPRRLVVLSCVVVCRASCGVVRRSSVCFVLCPLLCGVLVFLRRVVLGHDVLLLWCVAFVRCCVLCLFFFVFSFALFLALPWCSGLCLFLCSACAVLCWCACVVALCALLSCPCGAGWCFVLLSVVFACWLFGLAVLCCLLVGPGGSWCRVSVVCCGVSLGAVLRRVAARCAARGCLISFCSVWCCRVVCPVAVRRPGVLCLPALCFVVSRCAVCVLLKCVAAWCCSPLCFVPCASRGFVLCVPCPLLPVRCCCGALLSLGALLPCAVPCAAVLPCGAVVSRPAALFGLFPAFVWFLLLEKPLQNWLKYFFFFFFLK